MRSCACVVIDTIASKLSAMLWNKAKVALRMQSPVDAGDDRNLL
jgi:hypothetical protein